MPTAIVVATHNQGKLKEIKEALSDLDDLILLSLDDIDDPPQVEEDRATFEENAIKKAEALSAYTGLPAMADDSGLTVDALGGAPGVRSARYAGENATDRENNDRLLQALTGVPAEKRTAAFRCVIAVAAAGRETQIVQGSCRGIITGEPRGSLGFGYDPLFLDPASGLTFSEMDTAGKLKVSHRGRALAALREKLPRILPL